MRTFGITKLTFWSSHTIKSLKPLEAYVAHYLIESPHGNFIGYFYCPIGYISMDTRIPIKELKPILNRLIEVDFLRFDDKEWLFIVNYIKHNTPKGPRSWQGTVNAFNSIPHDCEYKLSLYNILNNHGLNDEHRSKIDFSFNELEEFNTSPIEAPSKPLRSPFDGASENTSQDVNGYVDVDVDVKNKNKDKEKKKPDKRETEILDVFEHYKKYHPNIHRKPNSKMKEWKKIKERLRVDGYSLEDLKLAIDGCHILPWNSGENPDGKKYQSLELILRDSSNVGRFMEASKNCPEIKRKSKREIYSEKWKEFADKNDMEEPTEDNIGQLAVYSITEELALNAINKGDKTWEKIIDLHSQMT